MKKKQRNATHLAVLSEAAAVVAAVGFRWHRAESRALALRVRVQSAAHFFTDNAQGLQLHLHLQAVGLIGLVLLDGAALVVFLDIKLQLGAESGRSQEGDGKNRLHQHFVIHCLFWFW